MSVSIQEVLTERVTSGDEPGTAWGRVHVEWSTIAFECGIKNLATSLEGPGDASIASTPVRLRVNEAETDSCRIEFFCASACLCRATAGC